MASIVVCVLAIVFSSIQIRKYSEQKSVDLKESGGIVEEIFYSVKTI